jgi:hypothetical protein
MATRKPVRKPAKAVDVTGRPTWPDTGVSITARPTAPEPPADEDEDDV